VTAGLRIGIDDAELQAVLARMQGWVQGDIAGTLDEIGARLEASTQNRFETETAPSGEPWKPSRASYDRGPAPGGQGKSAPHGDRGQTLTETGRLRASIARHVAGDAVEVGTNVVYAGIHQFGGKTPPRTIRPKRKKALYWPGAKHPVAAVRHPGSTIPARPFLGVSQGDAAAILRIVNARAAKVLK